MKSSPKTPSRKIRKTGLPPGSLIYTGERKTDLILKELVRYNADHLEQLDASMLQELDSKYLYWLDVRGLHNPQEIEAIGKAFGLDPLLMEDILDMDQRPKCELTEHGIFVIMKNLLRRDGENEYVKEQITLFLREGLLITFQEYPDDTFQAIKIRMQQAGSRIRTRKSDYLLYAIIDVITDHFFPVIDHCSERIRLLDEAININPAHQLKKSIYNVRKDISEIHRIVLPTRETISTLLRIESSLLTEKTRRYFKDVMDNIMQILDLNDNQSDQLASLHDLFMSDMTYRMTNVMRILTVVTSIFIPLTFITSIYGMNFKYQPEYNWPWAYGVLWIIMIIIAFAQVIYFRKKKWL